MSHLLQVGVGSGGIVALDLLMREPTLTHITLIEPDHYDHGNVDRHLFGYADVGKLKVELATAWIHARRPELQVNCLPVDLTDPAAQPMIHDAFQAATFAVCAVDNEPAKYHFDQLCRTHGKPWTLGEVLSGGIGGWVHRFEVGGPCYGCIVSSLQRSGPTDTPVSPAPDYSDPNAMSAAARIPASRGSIQSIATLHAAAAREQLLGEPPTWTSLLFTLMAVPEIFPEAYRAYRLKIARRPDCFLCSTVPVPLTGEALDVALDSALGRLAHE